MKFLVALDRSEKNRAVLAPAAALARAAGAEVLLLNVYNPWVDTVFSAAGTPKERLKEVAADRQTYLEEQARALAELPVATRAEPIHWPSGRGTEEVAEAVARVARESGADVLVVASKRSGGLPGVLLGSTVQALLRLSPCPVLVVRPG
jgi:nucleotide-binding universal stress UspA family protein